LDLAAPATPRHRRQRGCGCTAPRFAEFRHPSADRLERGSSFTQQGHGSVMPRRIRIAIARLWPSQAFSTKSFTPFAVSTTMLGRNRRTAKRPLGYSSCNRASVAVVSTCTEAQSKKVPAGKLQSMTVSNAQGHPCPASTPRPWPPVGRATRTQPSLAGHARLPQASLHV
jgi:hypothetical protein